MREQIWCTIHPDGYDSLNRTGTLIEVGSAGRHVGTYTVTSRWQARVGGGWMIAIQATLPGDDRIWRGRFAPDGAGGRYADGTVVIRPTAVN